MIHDLIIDKVEYNQTLYDNNFKDEDTAYSQSAYSVFCTDLTVCAGYSQAFEMMCNGSGIDAVAVTSYYHEWNKVRLNDSWYNVDCTWDDADGTIYYGYFERSDNYYDTVNYSSYVSMRKKISGRVTCRHVRSIPGRHPQHRERLPQSLRQ